MLRRLALTLLPCVAALFVLLAPRAARADQPGGHTVQVAVLGFDSEDADDQADALTGALRSRMRSASGWALIETTQSLGMLTAGLKCQTRPNPECQQRIAEQIRAERYVWGLVSKGPTVGQVTAEVHLYQKGKPDTALKETFSDNLKDPNDDKGIGKIASRIVERLGATTLGTIVVRVGEGGTGEVVVDGEKRVALANGTAKLDVAPGGHSVEVASPGGLPAKRNVLVTAGKEAVVEIGQAPARDAQPEAGKPFPTRKVLGGAALGAGVALGVVSVLSLTAYLGNVRDGKEIQGKIPDGKKPCEYTTGSSDEKAFCELEDKANTNSTVAWVTGTVGVVALGVGAYLFFADSPAEKGAAARYKTRVTPAVGSMSGVFVTGSF